MSRIGTLAWFLVRDLFLSVSGIVPLAAALAFGLIAFEYGMDQAQFMTVAGAGTGTLCLLTALLLAGRANRAASYPLLARLRRRSELLAALVLGSLGVTAVLAILITALNLAAGRLTLDWPSALWAVPTWLVFWLLVATLSLPLSSLVSRAGSSLVAWMLLVVLLVGYDQKARLIDRDLEWAAQALVVLFWPVSTLLSGASAGIHGRPYFLAGLLTLVYSALFFSLADQLFLEKDLLWSE